ncbi:MAG: SDR family NAD(P)-dependent oxidoreductase [Sphingorhabdus sp.]
MNRVLSGKVAVITGASRGIGAGIAKRFAAEGASVVLVARTAAAGGQLAGSLCEVAAEIRAAGGTCHIIQANLADPAELPRIIEETVSVFGGLDILVNNAAWSRFVPVWEVSDKQMRLAFQMNVFTPQSLMQLALPNMLSRGAGWILNISSATADHPGIAPWDRDSRGFEYNNKGHPTLYGTSKAALDRLSAGWAIELADKNIAVNSLAPVGAVASEGAVAVGGWDERDHIEPLEAMAEAALQFCVRPPGDLSGRVARSLPLLSELDVHVRSLQGREGWQE